MLCYVNPHTIYGLKGRRHLGYMESPITILQILLHQELTRECDRSPHMHPDDTSPQVHQGKISNNFFKKLSFYYAIIGV